MVTLTQEEMLEAAVVGCRRRIDSIFSGRKDNQRTNRDDAWQNDIEAAAAELALCKHLGLEWNRGVNTFKAPDAGVYQVRQTKYERGHLIVRPKDPDEATYVLVIGQCTVYVPVGWLTGREAKVHANWKVDAWWVPMEGLHPMSTL
jgi:hypothetical protein